MDIQSKTCRICGEHKEIAVFSRNKLTADGFQRSCKPCDKQLNAERTKRKQARTKGLLARQGGVCGCCGASEPGTAIGWHLDHDHACCPCPPRDACGKCDRGALCARCNMFVVAVADRADMLQMAREYLERHELRRAS